MSRDIRSFFISKKPQTPKVEDDDVIPESPEVQIKKKKKESRKKRVLEDSDEEIFTTKQKKSKEDTKKPSHSKNKSPKKGLKEVSAVDLFGNGPINRTEPMVKKVKKKTETGIHSDDEFDQSLLELDEVDEIKQVKGEKTISPVKRKDTIKSPTKNISVSNSKGSNSLEISANGAGSLKYKKQDEKQNEITAKENVFKSNGSDVKTNQVDKSPHKDSKKLKVHEKAMKIDEGAQKGTDLKTQHNAKLNKLNETAKTEKKVESNNSKCSRTQNSKFSEFIDDDNKTEDSDKNVKSNKRKFNNSLNESQLSDSQDDRGRKSKKKKLDATLNDSVLTDEERYERKRHSAALYQKYLNRSGPKHLGSKEIPEGSPNCLSNCAFLLTGVLDSFEREEVVAAITKYGGCVKSSMSKKVTHVLAGEDAGPAKIAKAEEFGIRILNEDEFLQMITDSKSSNKTGKDKKDTKRERSPNQKTPKKSSKVTKSSNSLEIKKETNHVKTETKSNHKSINIEIEKVDNSKNKINIPTVKSEKSIKQEVEVNQEQPKSEINGTNSAVNNLQAIMWVDKYKPQNLKQIIGQHGDASNVKKLSNWLTKWYVNRKAKVPKPSPWAKNDDGAYFKAALLSGPPGVGKTTTVSLVCKELGFDVVEFNASDTRSKSLIKEQVGELLTTTSLSGYAAGKTGKQAVTKKHVLVMDEVDGMAGNEDRGGLQELIGLIKVTSVPIICMCNDRNSQKMRSLVNYCYDLRFSRPRVDQIKSAMLSICFKEGLKIPPDVLGQLIVSANQDVRQTLNLLSMWAVDASLADAARLRKDAGGCKKDVKLGPWEAVRKVFSSEEHKSMSIHDKSDLFFYDYSLAPLFVQENYLQVAPHCPKSEVLSRLSAAADSLSVGDLVDARVRRCQAWGLLPVQAMYSSVIPGHHMSGHVTGQINFPGWLGKNSRAGKMQRLCQEIHAHTRLSTSGSKSSIFLDYSTHIRDAIINPLVRDKADGIPQALEVLEAYHLLREDLDSLVELSLWPGQRNPTVLIDSQVKAAMTRTYNKKASALPYAQTTIKRGKAQPDDELMDSEEIEGEEEVDDSDPEHDALIKKKSKEKISKNKETSSSKAGSSKQKASSSKKKK